MHWVRQCVGGFQRLDLNWNCAVVKTCFKMQANTISFLGALQWPFLQIIDSPREERYTLNRKSITEAFSMAEATISAKGWLVIPVELRKKYDLKPGARVMLVDYGGVLAIVPALSKPVEESKGMLKGGPSLLKALVEERKRERKRER